MALTINEQERKKAYDLCECIVIGFQNEYGVNTPEYKALQKVYERIHEEVKPYEIKEEILANEERGVRALAKYLAIPEYKAKMMLDPLLCREQTVIENILQDIEYTACYVGDFHQQILISKGNDPYKVIDVNEDRMYVTKEEAGKLLGVGKRQVEKYLHSGRLTVHHMEKHRAMIDVTEVYIFKENTKRRNIKGKE